MSSGGTWTIALDEADPVVGWNTLALTVTEPDTGEVADVTLSVDVDMPSMGHGSSEAVTVTVDGDRHVVEAYFQMDGAWELFGEVQAGGSAENWALPVEVVAP